MPAMSSEDGIPPGFTLRHPLRGHRQVINRIAWSPDGSTLASPSFDKTVRLWDTQTGKHMRTCKCSASIYSVTWSPGGRVLASGSGDDAIHLWDTQTAQDIRSFTGHYGSVYSVAWSPDGAVLASGSDDKTLRFWNVQTGKPLRTLTGHEQAVNSVAWSPDGAMLASGSGDQKICLWNPSTGQPLRTLIGHDSSVTGVAWSPNGRVLASGSDDKTIGVWNPHTGRRLHILEGHTSRITDVSFSYDGRLLASKSADGTVRLWRTDTWGAAVAILQEPASGYWLPGLAFHPHQPMLATLGDHDAIIRVWDLAPLLGITSTSQSIQYTNAKVVLVGDTGVGKTALGLVLTERPYDQQADSTHGRRVATFDTQDVKRDDGHREIRETLLWDLAGQPGYRLIHQLHLSEVAVALVVFDSRSETDPFAGVEHWVRALRVAERVQGAAAIPVKKFLVAARVDRGGKSASRKRIDTLVRQWGFDGYVETSAKEGINIALLAEAVKQAIDWDLLPRVTSTDLFQRIKTFLVAEKEEGRLLATCDDLYRVFLQSKKTLHHTDDLREQFDTCIGRVESKGLIRRLSFGDYVLLQPELLDAYASALVNAARDEPDGLGSISEELVRECDFSISKDERIADEKSERLLLIAMVEDLLHYEIVLREYSEDGPYLVFPSQSSRENPDLPDPEGKAMIFRFEGSILNIYATLAVRLSHSGLFVRKELWKNAVTYTTSNGGTYGLFLHNLGEGRAELTLFFDKAAGKETRFHFEDYVNIHLQRRALPETIRRRSIFVCHRCGTPLDDLHVTKRRERGFDWIRCGVCDAKVQITDREEYILAASSSFIAEMDQAADTQRARAKAASTIQGKVEIGEFDVFLCHNSNEQDKAKVKEIGEQLKERGILPWLYEKESRPGLPWQRLLEQQIGQIKSAAVFVGKNGIGPWQQMELEAFLREFVKRGCPVIPVLLPYARKKPQLPIFLQGMTWVDFQEDVDSLNRLIWGITGEHDR